MQVKQSAVKSMETDWDFRVARGPCIKMRKAVEPVACIDSGWTGTGDQRAGGCGRRSNYLRRTARRRRARAHYAKSGLQPETTSSLTRWFKRPPPPHTRPPTKVASPSISPQPPLILLTRGYVYPCYFNEHYLLMSYYPLLTTCSVKLELA